MIKYISFSVFISVIIIVVSCRQEIYEPFNSESIKNLLTKNNTKSQYSFSIYAENLTVNFLDSMRMNANGIRIYMKNYLCKNGEAKIEILTSSKESIFNKSIAIDEEKVYLASSIFRPYFVVLKFADFSGRIDFRITKAY